VNATLRSGVNRLFDDHATVDEVIRREVPMLASDWGVRDEDGLVHTLGINLFAALGRATGHAALVEFPVPRAERWQHKLVRVDSAWFDRTACRPVALVEFERFSLGTVLEKLTNLYVAAHGCDIAPDVLLLCLWALDGDRVDGGWFDGRDLTVPGGPIVPRPQESNVVLVQAAFGQHRDKLHFIRFRRLA
jgi:hypothetical protein